MIKEANSEDHVEQTQELSTFLLVDVGESQTTALLIKNVAGYCRLISRAMVKSTHKAPHNNAADGVLEAIQKLEWFGNQKILNQDKDLVMHTRQPGRGIDKFLISISMEQVMNTVVVAPTVDDPAVESAVHLLQRFSSTLDRLLTGANTRNLSENIVWMADNRPDLVLIVGSDARGNGMRDRIVQAAKAVGAGMRQFSEPYRPEVIYAASGHWTEDVAAALDIGDKLQTAPNLRPDARHERVKPVRKMIEEVVRRNHLARIPGLTEIMRWSGETPYSRNEGLAIFARFQAALVNGPILILDLDVNGLTMVYAKPKFTDLIVRTDLGLGSNLSETVKSLNLQMLSPWLSGYDNPENAAAALHTHFINRSIFPHSISQEKKEMDLDLTLLQALLSKGVKEASAAWGLDEDAPLTVNRLFVRGKILEMTGEEDSLILMLLNALQLQGECELFIDPHNAMALLGGLLEQEPEAAVDVIEADAFLNLGWLVGVSGRGRKGKDAVSISLFDDDSSEPLIKRDIARGELVSVGIPPNKLAHATVHYRRIGLSNTKKLEDIEGLKARVWIDARGRPAVLPDDCMDEWEHLDPK